ncbi:hypothetical protein N7533_002628 [Penicillium manginii]|uniref:uncharacterized protein n=1 Tax=Penicillium manginii TaxID=203109 RepID=UPI002547B585|nr:uncharacterized protein N7533_002628 [Penicillium manginii]KAJ5763947.1 hypothetical protein N7533_002628 [Penicillium manginii]
MQKEVFLLFLAPPERRLRRWRAHPPLSYLERLNRIQQTRMFIIGHEVGGTEEVPEVSFDVVGSTGNLYKTTIKRDPYCDCPDGAKGNQCKHICYVLVHALKAPLHLQYQLAFLSSELCEIMGGSSLSLTRPAPSVEENDGNRKPIDGDCPICFQEMIEAIEKIVWCKSACGNNLHKQCFDQWAAASRTSSGAGIRCVYCRAPWKNDTANMDAQSLRKNTANIGPEGYFNLASEFDLSPKRGTGPSL